MNRRSSKKWVTVRSKSFPVTSAVGGFNINNITSNCLHQALTGIVDTRLQQLTCPAVFAHPAVEAHLSPRGLAAIVAEVVIAGNAQLVALAAVVVLVAAHSDAVAEAGHWAVVQDGLPGVAGVDHAGVNAAFNQQLLLV